MFRTEANEGVGAESPTLMIVDDGQALKRQIKINDYSLYILDVAAIAYMIELIVDSSASS